MSNEVKVNLFFENIIALKTYLINCSPTNEAEPIALANLKAALKIGDVEDMEEKLDIYLKCINVTRQLQENYISIIKDLIALKD